MDRRYKGLIIAGVFLLGVVTFCKIQQRGDITYATAVGTVRTGKTLDVREKDRELSMPVSRVAVQRSA